MKHLIVCPEYPPAPIPPGGIGTYVMHISQLLAESGEIVHVIAQLWEGANKTIEERCDGRLIIHRVPASTCPFFLNEAPFAKQWVKEIKALTKSGSPEQCFAWYASLLAEELVEKEGIDVIESQDYAAPLYYFQLRRSLGLGPKRRPPCFIHLHSPTEFIARHNDWDIGLPHVLAAKRMEDFSIAAADGLLCPSQYFARQAEKHYGLAPGSIHVIPLPIGDSPELERDQKTWKNGTICYVGRLERRKGVIEWINAAVAIAAEYPEVHFEFIGENCLGTYQISGEDLLNQLIPEPLKPRFHFRGKQKRSVLPQFLKNARIAVVPSRWENFPNTCVEAMCSGLPVIASPEGGMAEMLKETATGWIAPHATVDGLTTVLRNALETSAEELAEMGSQAAIDIHQMCNNAKILDSHLAFRQQLCWQKVSPTPSFPSTATHTNQSLSRTVPQISTNGEAKGIAIVFICSDAHQLNDWLQNLADQTKSPTTVVIVDTSATQEQQLKILQLAKSIDALVVHHKNGNRATSKNLSIETVIQASLHPLGFVFIDAPYQLHPDFIAECEAVLEHCPNVGVVSCWSQQIEHKDQYWIKLCPGFPYQWLTNEFVPFSVIRTEALLDAGKFRSTMQSSYEDWDLFNAVLVQGWSAVTIPAILANGWGGENLALQTLNEHAITRMRRQLLERFPEHVKQDSIEVILLAESRSAQELQQELLTLKEQLNLAQLMVRSSQEEALKFLGKAKRDAFFIPFQMKNSAWQLLKAVKGKALRVVNSSRA